jgi:hypothetical protein
LQIVAVDKGLRGDFRVVAMSTCVEETFVVRILARIEDVVTFCAGTKRCHTVARSVSGDVWKVLFKFDFNLTQRGDNFVRDSVGTPEADPSHRKRFTCTVVVRLLHRGGVTCTR